MATSNSNAYSFESFVSFINNNFGVLLIAGLMFIAGFFIGSLWTENKLVTGGTRPAANVGADAGAPPAGAPEGPTEEQLSQVPALAEDDHVRGNRNAKVVLIEYSDFECPFCARFHPTMEQVMEEYGDQVAWVYRHFPLSFHPQAMPAAQASECVAELGGNDAFWAYGDELFRINSENGALTGDDLLEATAVAGVDRNAVQDCIDSGKYQDEVQAEMDAGSAAGVSGTPGTIVVTEDGQYEMINGALPFEQVKPIIEKYL